MSRTVERLRWLMGLAGLGFWLTGFSVLLAGESARWRWRCAGRDFDPDCFRDDLPVADIVMPLVAVILAYFIARYVFTMWAPAPAARRLFWWPASRRAGGELLWPAGHLLAAAGIAGSIWTLTRFPLVGLFWPYYLYWGVSALWCALTVWAAWPPREEPAI